MPPPHVYTRQPKQHSRGGSGRARRAERRDRAAYLLFATPSFVRISEA
eukprot:gene11473-biopygen4118